MSSRERFVRSAGWTLVVGSLLGACCAVVIIGGPREVSPERHSYPFGTGSFVAAQVFLAIRHLAETVGVLG